MRQSLPHGTKPSSGVVDVDAPILPLPEDGLMRVKDVMQYIRVGRTTWHEWVKSGFAPQPVKIGCNTFWRCRDLRRFIDEVSHAANA